MGFFKSVLNEPTPTPSPPSSPTPPNPKTAPPSSSSWGFGSTLFRTIASKSESLLDNYYTDLQEFSSVLKKETSVIREAASRAVQDLPARLESGAAIAQESLEAVGEAIDNVGSTVTGIIGKDFSFGRLDGIDDDNDGKSVGGGSGKDLDIGGNAKPYSRIEAMIRGLQCNVKTYCDEIEESDYGEWRLGFRIEEKREEIQNLFEENGVIKEIFNEIVPRKVDEETFWCRYFYRADRMVKAEEARVRIVKRAILSEEEEELSWDVDDDDSDHNGENDGYVSKGKMKEVEESAKSTKDLSLDSKEKEIERGGEDEAGASGTKTSTPDCEKAASESKIESDFSVISSQRSSHEDDFGWDEIEYIGSGDEGKVADYRIHSHDNKAGTHKRLSDYEGDEELTWDIEDDDQPIKS